MRTASEPEALIAFFRASGVKMKRVGFEAYSLTATCIETRQAKAAMGAMPNKTDRNDGRGIAQMHWLVSGDACKEPLLPIVASAADRASDGAE